METNQIILLVIAAHITFLGLMATTHTALYTFLFKFGSLVSGFTLGLMAFKVI